jgi:hypothetical protein
MLGASSTKRGKTERGTSKVYGRIERLEKSSSGVYR